MTTATDQVLEELQRTLGEFEGMVKAAFELGGEHASDTAGRLQAALGRARERLAGVEKVLGRDFQRGLRKADRYVHENAWVAIGVAAAAAFLLGVLAADRRE